MIDGVFHHVGVSAKNPIALEKFYTKYFGFERARVYAPGPDQVVMIKQGAIYLEIFKAEAERPTDPPKEAGPSYPSWRHICFNVKDLKAKLDALGDEVKVTLGPLDFSDFVDGMTTAWVADPEGNIIELNQGYQDEENPPPLEE